MDVEDDSLAIYSAILHRTLPSDYSDSATTEGQKEQYSTGLPVNELEFFISDLAIEYCIANYTSSQFSGGSSFDSHSFRTNRSKTSWCTIMDSTVRR